MKYCKWERIYYDLVPVPFGSGSCQMPSSDCVYEGDIEIPDDCGENCPAFEEVNEPIYGDNR